MDLTQSKAKKYTGHNASYFIETHVSKNMFVIGVGTDKNQHFARVQNQDILSIVNDMLAYLESIGI